MERPKHFQASRSREGQFQHAMSNIEASAPISDGFTYVERKKKSRKGKEPASSPSFEVLFAQTRKRLDASTWHEDFIGLFGLIVTLHISFSSSFHEIVIISACLRDSESSLQSLHTLGSVSRGLCLGLGSPSSSANSRAQLDALLLLCNVLGIVSTGNVLDGVLGTYLLTRC